MIIVYIHSITCTHYCILFTLDLVFSATCGAMSVSIRAIIVTSLGFRDAQYYCRYF